MARKALPILGVLLVLLIMGALLWRALTLLG
jgi:hypothetical protein